MKNSFLICFLLAFYMLKGQSLMLKFNPIAVFPFEVPINVHIYSGYEHRFSYRSTVEVGAGITWGTTLLAMDAGSSRIVSTNLKYRYYFHLKDSMIQKGFYTGGIFRYQRSVKSCGFWCSGQEKNNIWGAGAIVGKNTKVGKWGLLDVRAGVLCAIVDSEANIATYDDNGYLGPMSYSHSTYVAPMLIVEAHWGIVLGKKYRSNSALKRRE